MTELNREQTVADLLDPGKGYVLVKRYYTIEEVDAYRNDCEKLLARALICHTRINSDTCPDYIHPRSHDGVSRTYRIYQYPHNSHGPATDSFLKKGFTLRNQIEEAWLSDARYRAERARLQDYIIVTKYIANAGMLPRHRDYHGPAPFPLLQSLVLLCDCPDDYTGGDFILYTKSSRSLSLANDLGAQKGDLLLFDKSIDHSVEITFPGRRTSLGRWSVLIGARAPRDSRLAARLKSFLYSAPWYPYSLPVATRVMRLLKILN